MSAPLDAIFQSKYTEFATALKDAFPELSEVIAVSMEMEPEMKLDMYKSMVLPNAGSPKRDPTVFPGMVLPGVFINEATWTASSEGTKKAINQFLNLLTFTFVMKEGTHETGDDNMAGDAFKEWADSFMGQWRNKLNRADFESFTSRFAELFGSGENRLPPFPERLRHGKLAKLAEDIIKELKPEEFGLDPETVKQCEEDPSKAFEILMQSTMRNPEKIQTAMKRIIKKLQEKFQRGEFRPQDLASEAEEMMKEFSENPAFVEMMESMKKTFGFEDMDAAKAAGQEQSARMSIVKERLRRKQAAKGASMTQPNTTVVATNTTLEDDAGFSSILVSKPASKSGQKKHNKK